MTSMFWEQYIGEHGGAPPLVIIVGDVGSGKTATALSIADEYFNGYGSVHMLMDKPAFKNFKHLDGYHRIDPEKIKIPRNSIFIADDLHLHSHARDWASGRSRPLEELARERRHTNTMMIVTTQVTRVIDVNLLNMMSALVIKRPSIAQAKFDRGETAPMIRRAYNEIGEEEYDKAYIFSNVDDFEGTVSGIPLPSFWTDEISNAHRDHFGEEVQEPPSREVVQKPLITALNIVKAIGKAVR